MPWLMLAGAIVTEVIGTLALRGTADRFDPLRALIVLAGYVASFVLMAYALRTLNVGVVYAVWSGAGVALVAAAATVMYGEHLNLAAFVGIALIVLGVTVLAASGATSHA